MNGLNCIIKCLLAACLVLAYGCEQRTENNRKHNSGPAVGGDQQQADVWWPQHGLDASEQRFSELTQINTENVSDLGLAWSYQPPLPDDGFAATPIVVDGVVYMSGTFSTVFALDAVSGEEIWFYDPEIELGPWLQQFLVRPS